MRTCTFSLFTAALVSAAASTGCGGKSSDANSGNTSVVSNTGGVAASTATGGTSATVTLSAGGLSSTDTQSNMGGASTAIPKSSTGGSLTVASGGQVNVGGTTYVTVSTSLGGRTSSGVGGLQSSGGHSSAVLSTVVGPPTVDVLFMIDNSSSMADKQQVLARSLPSLLQKLVQPDCIDSAGVVVGMTQLDGTCAQGSPRFKPVSDLHLGVVTSSLGDHGQGKLCTPGAPTSVTDSNGNVIVQPDDVNDMGHLVGTLSRGAAALASFVKSADTRLDAQGFLAWGGGDQLPTATDLASAQTAFADMVGAVNEKGCGLESQLESWFRFLIDPVPPIYPISKSTTSQAQRLGSDDAVLAQRAGFLRPNSVLLIAMLTDENDCSLRDTDVGWVAANTTSSIATGSTACQSNPNDRCCYSCTLSVPPAGCANGCPNGSAAAPDDSAYQSNLRCWHQKRRFGYEFLYPVSRYVVGLTNPELCPDQTFGDMDCNCTYANTIGASCNPGSRRMPNPLYSNVVGTSNDGTQVLAAAQYAPRTDNSNVFLAGIVGVPWQDLGSVGASGNLSYIPVTYPDWNSAATALVPPVTAPNGIWSLIYGDDNNNIVPGDPHMIESIEPRVGITAYDNIEHEWNTAYQDLEYACVFPLPAPRACACDSVMSGYASCKYENPNDCCDLTFSVDGRGDASSGGDFNKPLCQGNTQIAAKAYPGLRELAVLHDYAEGVGIAPGASGNSIVTSICPKDLTGDASSPGYGYNPVMDAIVQRLAERLPKN